MLGEKRWDLIYEPNFPEDLPFGEQGERLVDRYLTAGPLRVEVKRKRRYVDLEFYVETEHDPGRRGRYVPSGINVTAAEAWAYVLGETGFVVIIPTGVLRAATRHPSARPREERDGDNPTRGVLVNIAAILAVMKEAAAAPATAGPDGVILACRRCDKAFVADRFGVCASCGELSPSLLAEYEKERELSGWLK